MEEIKRSLFTDDLKENSEESKITTRPINDFSKFAEHQYLKNAFLYNSNA